jgi:hypothetical protein
MAMGCLDACELPDMPAYIYHPIPTSTPVFPSITDILFQTVPSILLDFTTQPLPLPPPTRLPHHHQHVLPCCPIRLHPQPRRPPDAPHPPRGRRGRRHGLVHTRLVPDHIHHLVPLTTTFRTHRLALPQHLQCRVDRVDSSHCGGPQHAQCSNPKKKLPPRHTSKSQKPKDKDFVEHPSHQPLHVTLCHVTSRTPVCAGLTRTTLDASTTHTQPSASQQLTMALHTSLQTATRGT